jgi:hypothetical protein
MERKKSPPGDEYNIRCPRLGHQISFSYCRTENQGLPCFKTLDCWYNHFQVEEFLKEEIEPEVWEKVFAAPPKPKVLSLLELIEEAKNRDSGEL